MLWVVKFTAGKNIFGIMITHADNPIDALQTAVECITHGNEEYQWEIFPLNSYYAVKLVGNIPIREELKDEISKE